MRVCTICEKPLDDGRLIQESLDGEGAHVECLEAIDEGDDA